MRKKDSNRTNFLFNIIKLISLLTVISILVYATIKLYPFFKNINSTEGRLELKATIDSLGYKGSLLVILLVIIQLLLAFIPGEPVEIIAGMCCGTIGGLIVVFIGVFIASCIIFFSVRKFGKDFIYSFFGKEKIDKLENNQLFSNKKKLDLILFIIFFIPGTPKDLFIYLGGLLPVKPLSFLLISTFARFPSVITSTYCGANLIDGNFKTSIIVFVCTFVVSVIGIVIYNKFYNYRKL